MVRDDRFQRSDTALEYADPREKPLLDAVIQGRRAPDIEDRDPLLRLPDPVDAPDALLDLHRVPRQVVVHDRGAELEVQTFTGHFVGQHEVVPTVTKVRHDLVSAVTVDPTVKDCHPAAV